MKELVPCHLCSQKIDAKNWQTHEFITGYSRKGNAGGSDIVLRKGTGRFACGSCVEKMRAGIPVGQGSLV